MGQNATRIRKIKKTPDQKMLGLTIRHFRYKRNMTQMQLAEKANIHPTYIGSIERGERNLSFQNILNIARGLKVSPKELMPD